MLTALVLAASMAGQIAGTPAPNLPPIILVVPPGIPGDPGAMDLDTAVRNISFRKGFRHPFPNRPPLGLPSGVYILPVWAYPLAY